MSKDNIVKCAYCNRKRKIEAMSKVKDEEGVKNICYYCKKNMELLQKRIFMQKYLVI